MIEFASFPDQKLQNAFNTIRNAILTLRSVPERIVADVASLPKPVAALNGCSIIVRDIDGFGAKGRATCLDGAWYDQNWSAL